MTRRPLLLLTAAALIASALALVAAANAGNPSPADENGRAVHVVCPDGTGGVATPAIGPVDPPDCDTLAEALQAATDDGLTDDLILLRPGFYCPVDLPQSNAGRLYLQGVSREALPPAGGDVAAPTHSDVEDVVFAPYANDHCASIYNNDVIRMGPSGGLAFLENLSVDGSGDPTYVFGTSTVANNGIELAGSSSYVRDVVVKHAATGLLISGGEVSHSAFVQNQYVGVQTAPNRPTWLQDVLIADTRTASGTAGTGLYEGTSTNFAQNADTLRNVTLTGNRVGLGRPPSTYNTSTHVRNTLIAGNDTDCDYAYAGSEGGSDDNAVGSSCYSLSTGEHAVTTDGSTIADVEYVGGLEPFADPGPTDPVGDPGTCSPTDQLERARSGCYVGAISPITEVPAGGPSPVSDFVAFPAGLDLGDTGSATASLSSNRDGLVVVRDVSASTGFTVTRDSCSLGTLPLTWPTGQAAGGSAPQPSCTIAVIASGPATGALTITTNKGTIVIPLSSEGGSSTDPGGESSTPATDTTSTRSPSASPSRPPSSAPPKAAHHKPGKPTKVKAKAKRRAAVVTWKAASGATSYRVQVKTHGRWVTKARTTARKARVRRLKSHAKTQLRVVAVNAAGQTPSAVVKVRPL